MLSNYYSHTYSHPHKLTSSLSFITRSLNSVSPSSIFCPLVFTLRCAQLTERIHYTGANKLEYHIHTIISWKSPVGSSPVIAWVRNWGWQCSNRNANAMLHGIVLCHSPLLKYLFINSNCGNELWMEWFSPDTQKWSIMTMTLNHNFDPLLSYARTLSFRLIFSLSIALAFLLLTKETASSRVCVLLFHLVTPAWVHISLFYTYMHAILSLV